jgi:hypothetical protein
VAAAAAAATMVSSLTIDEAYALTAAMSTARAGITHISTYAGMCGAPLWSLEETLIM